ncbi:hypothetical protein Pmani_028149 [Petrolisthes manimaculis]|uniref:Uncharacterized protein n=1 Tax=Petrolisthes manimaculis TaxID=1843537 RepID=A0AAE1TY97_9EUCA|nr:hypothetical protein Pmani_028149 [Petrolisthes manimaculis]
MSEISLKAREAAREEYDVNKIGHIGDDNDDEYSFFSFLFHHTRHASTSADRGSQPGEMVTRDRCGPAR